ncbi:hypothetical protein LEP1GSC036_4770 [Leptospira weilii str. 2006001853]|uniref:Uncharacterized protein n=4 Tax=Leptospira weilii TaxID=28184 RepID=A0A828Z263_9LEPT|nr:hypothetical protein LEP1GSC036_4770 [Leptospira weilii str. 2006001853]EMJ66969.1 hypothetical protein LEP1GSC051_0938 [Leptospira sp. P2653]EMM74728.1 hypothetical protein LEP1GSC038_4334 [Leptospira weilii str. 2006001855]EMN45673.1 hypothetical protein LEP1GSC086_2555 [Leptospira weilii str. LNT 1234]EMN88284.1 hypothetical protein LEP1GSC108_1471 [Leptospira weilii str. UI 13098]EMY12200.1 hypothetical protein LEP1GSC043_0960 [Leptospira weilii str. Ecochallenge]OMI17202.1 hypothetica
MFWKQGNFPFKTFLLYLEFEGNNSFFQELFPYEQCRFKISNHLFCFLLYADFCQIDKKNVFYFKNLSYLSMQSDL